MNDIFHEWGSDLGIGNCGDLAVATSSDAVNQRVYRRLLTNPGDYLWHLDYGGGLAQFVGKPADPMEIEAVVRAQLRLDTAVPASPVPKINVELADPSSGCVIATIIYSDQEASLPVILNVSTG